MKTGHFCLVIAGDGIRSEALVIAEFLRAAGNLRFSLGLIQVDVYRRGERLLVQPRVPSKVQTEVRTVFVGSNEEPGADEDDEQDGGTDGAPGAPEAPEDPLASVDREFWQSFIDEVKLQHPDQPRPRHGGRNWVRLSFPAPACWLTLYRFRGAKPRIGAFLAFRGPDGHDLFERLMAERNEIEEEIGMPLSWDSSRRDRWTIALLQNWASIDDPSTHAAQKAWLSDAANRMVNTFRPRVRARPG